MCIAAAGLFAITVVVLVFTNLTKNKYYFNYREDELLKKERTTNSVNSIYLTSGETGRFIKKYVVCKSAYEKYLVCNFTEKFREIKFFVVQFSRRKRVLSVLEITQKDIKGDASRVIALKRTCAHVNVVISSANGQEINRNYVRPISMTRLRLYAFLKSLAIFLALFVIRHAIVEFAGGKAIVSHYLGSVMNYVAIALSFVLSLFSYLITVLSFRRRNAKVRNGGALEYEFV